MNTADVKYRHVQGLCDAAFQALDIRIPGSLQDPLGGERLFTTKRSRLLFSRGGAATRNRDLGRTTGDDVRGIAELKRALTTKFRTKDLQLGPDKLSPNQCHPAAPTPASANSKILKAWTPEKGTAEWHEMNKMPSNLRQSTLDFTLYATGHRLGHGRTLRDTKHIGLEIGQVGHPNNQIVA